MYQARCTAGRHALTAHENAIRTAIVDALRRCAVALTPRRARATCTVAALLAITLTGALPTVDARSVDADDKSGEAGEQRVRIGRPLAIDPRTPVEDNSDTASTPSQREAMDDAAEEESQSESTPAQPNDVAIDGNTNDAAPEAADLPAGGALDPLASADDDAPAYQPPPREHLPLGQPNAAAHGSGDAMSPTAGDTDSTLGQLDPRTNQITRTLLALLAVIALILIMRPVLARVARSFGIGGDIVGRARRPSGVLEVLARYPIGRGQQLMLLKLDRRVLLLHHAGQQMTPLCDVNDPTQVASLLARVEAGSRGGSEQAFEQALQRLSRQYDAPRDTGRGSGATASGQSEPAARSRRSSPTPDLPPALAHLDHSDIETIDLTRSQGGGWRALLAPFGRSGRPGR